MSQSEDWLIQEDMVCFADRAARLDWIAAIMPTAEYLTFPSGLMAKYLFEEARYCFVYGQFLAVIVLGLAFLEKTLASRFFMAGRNDLERASISRLLHEARNKAWLTEDEYEKLERIRLARNPVAHFRAPLAEDSIEFRALGKENHPYSVIEQDSRDVIEAVMHMLGRNAV
ncbi:MAG: hypothetical protein HZA47_10515 [Planctomycetes bacterium]|uniref:hypothetical protein n=1 Tax=Candidatus Wunengus sp. YC65 TaxID=3367701 RepID=UPI001D3515E8|nr:hypothetical protein [Planctomycetota bacterium]